MNKSPALKAGVAQVKQELIDAVKEAEKALNQAKAEVEAAISKTKAEIEKAKAKFEEAKAQFDSAVAAFNQAKAAAEGALQSLTAEKSQIAGSLQMLRPDLSGGELATIWSEAKEEVQGKPLSFAPPLLKESFQIFQASQFFTIVVVPVTVQETITAEPQLSFGASLVKPLQAEADGASVMLGTQTEHAS